MQPIMLLALAPVTASSFWTANDPFVGKWILDVPRSTIVDQMRVEVTGRNMYRFNFEDGPAETIVADGTDQPGLPGTTLWVKKVDERSLAVVRKQQGRVIISATWTLSPDGNTLRDAFKSFEQNGTSTTVNYVYRRTSGTAGFAGTWESTTKPVGLKLELTMQPYDSSGLSFLSGTSERNIIFDGRDHAAPGTTDGVTFSGRRPSTRRLEYTEANRGRIERVRQFQLSRDGRTLTEVVQIAGQNTPNVLVFDRE